MLPDLPLLSETLQTTRNQTSSSGGCVACSTRRVMLAILAERFLVVITNGQSSMTFGIEVDKVSPALIADCAYGWDTVCL